MTQHTPQTPTVKQSSAKQRDERARRTADMGPYLYKLLTEGANLRMLLSDDNPLSLNEMIALLLPVLGYRYKECAFIMDISPDTFKDYQARIREKLGVKNTAQAFYVIQTRGYCRVLTDEQLRACHPFGDETF